MASGTSKKVTSDSGTGYCKMPDGTLIQWGKAGGGGATGTSASFPVTFAIPFTDAPHIAFGVHNDSSGHYDNVSSSYVNLSGSGFTVRLSRPSSGYIGSVVLWIAIGRWK